MSLSTEKFTILMAILKINSTSDKTSSSVGMTSVFYWISIRTHTGKKMVTF